MGVFSSVVTLFSDILHSCTYFNSILIVPLTILSVIILLSFFPKIINFFRGD